MTTPARRTILAAVGVGLAAAAGCSGDGSGAAGDTRGGTGGGAGRPGSTAPPPPPVAVATTRPPSRALGGDVVSMAVATSAAFLVSSPVAVLCPDDPALLTVAADLAQRGHWPVLVATPGVALPEPTAQELDRLGVDHVLVVGPGPEVTPPGGLDRLEIHLVVVDGPTPATIPDGVPVGGPGPSVEATVITAAPASPSAALATAHALGTTVLTGVEDPREDATVMAALRAAPDRPVLALDTEPAVADRLLGKAVMAQRAPELPGGGVTVFPHRRMVALYGHPSGAALGLLGEQGIDASIARVRDLARAYAGQVGEPVIPAWEIIASVATGGAGEDGTYSKAWPPEYFRPWVDAARAAGIYVVLDLQPGRNDFLTQARIYEDLLREPHVGLALDPEWRIGPDERHLVRIGHVEAQEVNAVSAWLAELVRGHHLPQKVLTLHQFQLGMIRDRHLVRTDHPELAVVLHVDGQGSQGAKQATWRALKADLPSGMWLGWKNFHDEDAPMLTPEQTVARVDPTPWFISYQ